MSDSSLYTISKEDKCTTQSYFFKQQKVLNHTVDFDFIKFGVVHTSINQIWGYNVLHTTTRVSEILIYGVYGNSSPNKNNRGKNYLGKLVFNSTDATQEQVNGTVELLTSKDGEGELEKILSELI